MNAPAPPHVPVNNAGATGNANTSGNANTAPTNTNNGDGGPAVSDDSDWED